MLGISHKSPIINTLKQASEALEVPQEITLYKTKHTAVTIVSQQKPISFGPQNRRELKEGDSMLLRTGKPPDVRGAVSLSNRLKVRVPGKKFKKGSLDVRLVNLVNAKRM